MQSDKIGPIPYGISVDFHILKVGVTLYKG